jgi:uncharacterized protein (DUF1919 family)
MIKRRLYNRLKQLDRSLQRARLKNPTFSIIANNCWGGKIYQDLGFEYRSPFIGLFLYSPCYIRLLERLQYFLSSELTFIPDSRYEMARQDRARNHYTYPIGLLGGELEIHFLHYQDSQEAYEKWNRRLQRVNFDNLFVSFVDRYLFEDSYLPRFEKIPYPKVLFTAKNFPDSRSSVWMKEFAEAGRVGNVMSTFKKYFDVIDWLNGGLGRPNFPMGLINRFFSILNQNEFWLQ